MDATWWEHVQQSRDARDKLAAELGRESIEALTTDGSAVKAVGRAPGRDTINGYSTREIRVTKDATHPQAAQAVAAMPATVDGIAVQPVMREYDPQPITTVDCGDVDKGWSDMTSNVVCTIEVPDSWYPNISDPIHIQTLFPSSENENHDTNACGPLTAAHGYWNTSCSSYADRDTWQDHGSGTNSLGTPDYDDTTGDYVWFQDSRIDGVYTHKGRKSGYGAWNDMDVLIENNRQIHHMGATTGWEAGTINQVDMSWTGPACQNIQSHGFDADILTATGDSGCAIYTWEETDTNAWPWLVGMSQVAHGDTGTITACTNGKDATYWEKVQGTSVNGLRADGFKPIMCP